MAPCFSLPCDPHNQPKLPSFLKAFCFPSCHGPFSSSPLTVPFDHDDDGAADDSDLNNQVIILEIRQRAMMKARSQSESSFMIMTAEEFGKLIKAAALPLKVDKSDDAQGREKKDGEYEGDDEDEEFFSVRSCFSRCSNGDEEYCLSARTTPAVVTLSEEWFKECEGWPFGLWRRRKVVVLPPLPKSPADSWTWHKRNLSNVKV